MNMRTLSVVVLICCLSTLAFGAAPKVMKTVPESGDIAVAPGLTKIRILFDQDMNTGGMSICNTDDPFPEIVGKPKWAGKRQLVFGAKLEPGRQYGFSINCPTAQNCKSVQGEPAEIYFVRFMTTFEGGYVVHFTAKDNAELTRKELLDAFNAQCPKSVHTFYFRTEMKDGKLQGSIFTPTQEGSELLKKMLAEHATLTLVAVEAVDPEQLKTHTAKK